MVNSAMQFGFLLHSDIAHPLMIKALVMGCFGNDLPNKAKKKSGNVRNTTYTKLPIQLA